MGGTILCWEINLQIISDLSAETSFKDNRGWEPCSAYLWALFLWSGRLRWLFWPAIQWSYWHAWMTNPQEPTANQNWLYQIGSTTGSHYVRSLMHIPKVNISLSLQVYFVLRKSRMTDINMLFFREICTEKGIAQDVFWTISFFPESLLMIYVDFEGFCFYATFS